MNEGERERERERNIKIDRETSRSFYLSFNLSKESFDARMMV